MNPEQSKLLPATPEEAAIRRAIVERLAYRDYRRRTRPFRRAFRGVISRKEAERLYLSAKRARERGQG